MAGNRVADVKTLTVWFLTTLANPAVPTVTELTAGKNITCDIEKGSSIIGYTDDKTTTSSGTLCEIDDIDTWVGGKYSGEHTYYKRYTAGVLAVDDVSVNLPAPGAYGYMVVREGFPYDTAAAVAQKVEVYYVQGGIMKPMRGNGESVLRFSQKYMSAGLARLNVALAS